MERDGNEKNYLASQTAKGIGQETLHVVLSHWPDDSPGTQVFVHPPSSDEVCGR